MGSELVYEIARYAVDTDAEVLVERAQVLAEDGVLRQRDVDGAEAPCDEKDVAAVIAAHPPLKEVRANQVTRITAVPAVLNELPFVLYPAGEWEDFDEELWSDTMRAHIEEDWRENPPFDAYRALYINEKRWCTWHTSLDDRLLPEDLEASIAPSWCEVSLYEYGEMASGESRSALGPLTSAAAIDITSLDADFAEADADDTTVGLYWRDGSVDADARIVADWLLNSPVPWYFYHDGDYVDPILFVQLFIEATNDPTNQASEGAKNLPKPPGTP